MVKNNNKKNNGTNALRGLLAFLVALAVFLGVELIPQLTENLGPDNHPSYTESSDIYEGSYKSRLSLDDIAPFDGEPYIVVNGNVPFFTEADITTEPFELFSELDDLGLRDCLRKCVPRADAYGRTRVYRFREAVRLAPEQIRLRGWQVPLQSLSSAGLSAYRRERQCQEPHHRNSLPQCYWYAAV